MGGSRSAFSTPKDLMFSLLHELHHFVPVTTQELNDSGLLPTLDVTRKLSARFTRTTTFLAPAESLFIISALGVNKDMVAGTCHF